MDPPRDFLENSFNHSQSGEGDQFSFVSTNTQNNTEITGTLEGGGTNFGDENNLRHRILDNKYTNSLLGNKGINWLLEVEDEDDDTFQKPLL